MTNTTTAPRTADHLAMGYGSEVVHAAKDTARMHTLACNGRTMSAGAWNGTPDQVTCKGCRKALETGKAVWVG